MDNRRQGRKYYFIKNFYLHPLQKTWRTLRETAFCDSFFFIIFIAGD
jgi:hypothetical protein